MTWFVSSILSFANHHKYVDTRDLASNYILISWSNGQACLTKVVEHGEMSKLHFGPRSNSAHMWPESASHLDYFVARHVLDKMPAWLPCTERALTIAELHYHTLSALLLKGRGTRAPSRPLPLALTPSAIALFPLCSRVAMQLHYTLAKV